MILAIIQARTGSTRLPGKVMMDLLGEPVIDHVLRRMHAVPEVDQTVVATTVETGDDELVEHLKRAGVALFRGSSDNVLDRYYRAAHSFHPDHIIRITADCPMIDSQVVSKVVRTHLETGSDYTSNILKESYPDGLDAEIFTAETLERTWRKARLASEREHVTLYIRNNPQTFKLANVANPRDLSSHRWTLDEPADYEFLSRIFQRLGNDRHLFGMDDVLRVLAEDPSLLELNSSIRRNEGLIKSLEDDHDAD